MTDSHDPPLPQRVRGGRRGTGTGSEAPLVLPESVTQRIRAALDGTGEQASPQSPQDHRASAERPGQDHTAPAKRPGSLPQRVPGTGHGPELPMSIRRPVLPPSWPRPPSAEALTEPLPAIPPSKASGVTAEDGIRPDIVAQPETATAPAGPNLIPALRAPAQRRLGRQDRRDERTASAKKAPAGQKAPALRNKVQASPGKAPARQAAAPAGLPKPARPQARARRRRGISAGVILVSGPPLRRIAGLPADPPCRHADHGQRSHDQR